MVVRLDVPRQNSDEAQARPFDLYASNIDVLLEVNPEGKVSVGSGARVIRIADVSVG